MSTHDHLTATTHPAVDSSMFLVTARMAIRAGVKAEGKKIGLSDLDEETQSLAYQLAEMTRIRIANVIVERQL